MPIQSAIEQYAGAVGKELATSYDYAQADFFNGFCEMLDHHIRSEFERSRQIAFFTARMTPHAKRVMLEIAAFCETSRA